jgi:hypothetical protein
MKRFVSIFAVLVLTSMVAFAQADAMKQKEVKDDAMKAMKAEKSTLKGYIVDKMCASGHADELSTMAPGHTKTCALSEACLKSGLGIVSEGKWYGFDEKGSAKAASLLKKAKAEKGAMWEVTGVMTGDQLVVSSIKELDAKAM